MRRPVRLAALLLLLSACVHRPPVCTPVTFTREATFAGEPAEVERRVADWQASLPGCRLGERTQTVMEGKLTVHVRLVCSGCPGYPGGPG